MSSLLKWCGMELIKWNGNSSMETKKDPHCWMVIKGYVIGSKFRVGFYCILQQFGDQKLRVVCENG
jgi:hypothetical protein